MKTINKKTTTSMLLATILLTGLLGTIGQSAYADPSPITLISGNGAPGNPDAEVNYTSGPFGTLDSTDFANAVGGLDAQIITTPHGAWNNNPGPGGSLWIADNVLGNVNAADALYAQQFVIDCTDGIASASLSFAYSVDNSFGDTNNEGLFINGNPVVGSKNLNTDLFIATQNIGPFDITSDAVQGANYLFAYQDNSGVGNPAGIQYEATIEYDCYIQETAWADDDVNGGDFSGKNWATYIEYVEDCTTFTGDLLAGQTIDAGDVTIECNGTEVTITIAMQNDWELVETHLHVGEVVSDIPQKKGNPPPGQFDIHDDTGLLVFVVDIEESTGVIALHTVVQIPESLL